MTKTIVDLEAHIKDSQNIIWTFGGKRVQDWQKERVVERTFHSAEDLCVSKGIKLSILNITNFDDRRAEFFRKISRVYWECHDLHEDERMFRISDKERSAYFLAGQEIASDVGHITLVGLPFDYYLDTSQRKNLDPEKILSEAEEQGAIVMIEYGKAGILEKVFGSLFNSVANKQSARMSANKEFLDTNVGRIDVIKSDLTYRNIPVIAVSDSHTPDEANGPFSSYAVFENIDFSNGESVVASLKSGISSNNYENHFGRKSLSENLRHAGIVLGCALSMESGLMKRDYS